jgi:hypothetical protein
MRITILAVAVGAVLLVPSVQGGSILTNPLADAANYSILYAGGHNFQLTNVGVETNIGVGRAGVVKFSSIAERSEQCDQRQML